MHDSLVYLNGHYLPLSDANIPVLDRGFIFGDGIYDVLPLYQGRPFRALDHLARLARSLAAIGIANPHTAEEWLDCMAPVARAQPQAAQLLYVQVTRGVAPRAHAFPSDAVSPTVFVMSLALVLPSAQVLEQGVACVSMEDARWLHCDIKSTSLLGNVLAAQHAASHAATEVLQFRGDYLTEGAASNVWLVKDGRLLAPPRDNLILEGIRYGLLEELCAALGIPFSARRLTREDVASADEILLSSASKEVLPVTRLNDAPVGTGRPGPVFARLYEAYQEAKQAAVASQPPL